MSNEPKFTDWMQLIGCVCFALYFAIAAYGRYRTMFPR